MLPEYWVDLLKQTLNRLQQSKQRPLRTAIVGIGHELRGDDAAGLAVAAQLRPLANDSLLVIEAGPAPENHTALLRRFKPDLILFIDAAQLGQSPGAICCLPWQETSGLSASTHTLPLYMLAHFLTAELGCEVSLIGIQPQQTDLGSALSPVIEEATRDVAQALIDLLEDE
jgi:hydrogenase maturation protease HycI